MSSKQGCAVAVTYSQLPNARGLQQVQAATAADVGRSAPAVTIGRHELHDLYLAVTGSVVPVVGPTAPMHAGAATATTSSGPQLSATTAPDATVLRTRVAEWYCPACLTVPKRAAADGRCTYCFECPECPGGVLSYKSRIKDKSGAVACNLVCGTCAWSSRDEGDHSKDVAQRWHGVRPPVELDAHLAATRGLLTGALAPFSTAAAGTEAEAEERRAKAARAGTTACAVRDADVAERHAQLLARLKLGSTARAAHLAALAKGSGAQTVREMTAPGAAFPDPGYALPVSVAMLAGVNPRNHPSVLQLSLQERGRDQPMAQGGIARFGPSAVVDKTSPSSPQPSSPAGGRLGDAIPPLRLVGVQLLPRASVEGVMAAEASNPTARVTQVARLAQYDVVVAAPDAKSGHDYAYRVLSHKAEGGDPDSLNAARLLPQVRVCPLYQAVPEDPAQAAAENRPPPRPQPTATFAAPVAGAVRSYEVGLYLDAALKLQSTTVTNIAVEESLCEHCSVVTTLPRFKGSSSSDSGGDDSIIACSPPLVLQQRADVPADVTFRYGNHRGDFVANQPRAAAHDEPNADPAAVGLILKSRFRNVAAGLPRAPSAVVDVDATAEAAADAMTEAAAVSKALGGAAATASVLDVGNRAAFLAVVTDRRSRPVGQVMRVAFRIDAQIGGVPVSYAAHVAVEVPHGP